MHGKSKAMSIVARQSFKYTLIGYLGFFLGTFSAIFVFNRDFEFYGKLRFIMNSAEIIAPFILLGVSYSNVKFFLKAKQENKHHNMLSVSLLAVGIHFLVFLLGFFVAPFLFPNIKNLEIWKYRHFVLPLVFILSVSPVFNKFISNYKRVAISNILDNLFPKMANLVAFCLFFFLGASQLVSFGVFISFFALSMLGYIAYANRLERIKWDFSKDFFRKDNLWKDFIHYSFFGFLGTFGNQLNINNQMVGEFLGMEDMGVYSILYSLISLISIPQMGLFNVSAPIINQALHEEKYEELDVFYKKTSLSLFFLGAVLFSCIVVGFPHLAFMMKNGDLLMDYQPVIWIWGTAVLFDLATGFNGNILSLSKYYKVNIWVMLLLAGLTIGLNWYFIQNTELRLIGISISTAISVTLYNLIKVGFNYWKFKVSPFTIEMIFGSILCTLAISICMILPDFKVALLNLVYKPLVVLGIIFIGNKVMNIIPLEEVWKKIFEKKNRVD